MSFAYLSFQRSFLSYLYRNTNYTFKKKGDEYPPNHHPKQKGRGILKESGFNIILFHLSREDFRNTCSHL